MHERSSRTVIDRYAIERNDASEQGIHRMGGVFPHPYVQKGFDEDTYAIERNDASEHRMGGVFPHPYVQKNAFLCSHPKLIGLLAIM